MFLLTEGVIQGVPFLSYTRPPTHDLDGTKSKQFVTSQTNLANLLVCVITTFNRKLSISLLYNYVYNEDYTITYTTKIIQLRIQRRLYNYMYTPSIIQSR